MVAKIKVLLTRCMAQGGIFWDELCPLGILTLTNPWICNPLSLFHPLLSPSITRPFLCSFLFCSSLSFSLSNFTLQYMPLPLSDISQAYRSAPERTEQALTKVGIGEPLTQLMSEIQTCQTQSARFYDVFRVFNIFSMMFNLYLAFQPIIHREALDQNWADILGFQTEKLYPKRFFIFKQNKSEDKLCMCWVSLWLDRPICVMIIINILLLKKLI